MSSSSPGPDDSPQPRREPPAETDPAASLSLVDPADEAVPAGVERVAELPYGALVAFDGSGPDAWIAVGRECCIALGDTE